MWVIGTLGLHRNSQEFRDDPRTSIHFQEYPILTKTIHGLLKNKMQMLIQSIIWYEEAITVMVWLTSIRWDGWRYAATSWGCLFMSAHAIVSYAYRLICFCWSNSKPFPAKFRAGTHSGFSTRNVGNCEIIKSGCNSCQQPEHQSSGPPPQ